MYEIYAEKCNGIREPEGVSGHLDFSWRLKSDREGAFQQKYCITVYDCFMRIVWESGIVTSNKTHNISYTGKTLLSSANYFWKVVSYSNYGEWYDSGMLHFFVSLQKNEEWNAKWIRSDSIRRKSEDETDMCLIMSGTLPPLKHPEEKLNPCIYFRKEINIAKKVKQAAVYATAHGIYDLQINGNSIGQPLAPGYTVYGKYLEYQSYQVTNYIQAGINVIGSIIADGWYLGKVGLLGIGDQFGTETAFLMQLEIIYEDGTKEIFGTDDTFQCGTGGYLYADLYIGEGYNENLEPFGWMQPGYHNPDWRNAVTENYGYEQLVGRKDEPAAYIRIEKAKEIIITPRNETVVNVGENIAGFLEIKGNAHKGERILLEYSEVLDRDGNFIHNIAGQNKNQTDVYIAGSNGTFCYRPKFTFHGFQYVRITGISGLRLENIQVFVLSADMERTGSFRCSDRKINQLQENIFRSQQGNMLYIPTDCPQREKSGFTGDMQIYAPTACYLMDVEAFLRKWLTNLRLDQTEDGQVPDTVPFIPSSKYIHETVCSSGWGDACVIVPYRLYMTYGDKSILEENFECMGRWMAYIEKRAKEGIPGKLKGASAERLQYQQYLWNTDFHFGDWLIPSLSRQGIFNPMEGAEMTKELVAPAMYAYSVSLMEKICRALGKTDLENHYQELHRKIQEAYSYEYLMPDGRLKLDYQGMYVLALQMNLVPEDRKELLVNRLVELIHENDGCLDTGFLSIPFLLDVLYENGKREEAFHLLYQEKCPSWMYEIDHGANTIWESWTNITPEGNVTNASYNHFAFGCVGDFIYRRILGLIALEPGYRKVKIQPDISCRLQWAEGSFESINGTISVTWEHCKNKAVMNVILPPGVEAELRLGESILQVESGKHHMEANV